MEPEAADHLLGSVVSLASLANTQASSRRLFFHLADGSTLFKARRELEVRADQLPVDIGLAYDSSALLHDTEIWLGRANSQP
jgi:hypothetical protein